MIEIPLPLRTAIESGSCVLFVGSGIGLHSTSPDGSSAPTGSQLASDLAAYFNIEIRAGTTSANLQSIARVVELRHGRVELQSFIQKRLADLEPDEILRWLFTRRWSAIFTTNYDNVIQRAYELIPSPPQTPITCTISSDLVRHDPRFEVPLIHLHGTVFGNQSSEIVITEEDYSKFSEKRKMLFDFMKVQFSTCPVLYIGYANADPDWSHLLNEITSDFYPSPLPQSFRVAPTTDPLEVEILRSRNIQTIDATLEQVVGVLAPILDQTAIDSERYLDAAESIPSDLKESFDATPAPTLRLLDSWTYVNQAPFHEAPNIHTFLSVNYRP